MWSPFDQAAAGFASGMELLGPKLGAFIALAGLVRLLTLRHSHHHMSGKETLCWIGGIITWAVMNTFTHIFF